MTTATPPSMPAPFWRELDRIALYPLRGDALVALAVFSACAPIGRLPGIGWILGFVVWVAIHKYAFEILITTAQGRSDAPQMIAEADNGIVWRYLLLQLLAFALLALAAWYGGKPAAFVLALLLSIVMTGATLSLALDGELATALHPATWLGLFARIGWPYAAACLALFAFQHALDIAAERLGTAMPTLLGDVLLTALKSWGLFATFHLMGRLVFEHRDALGYTAAEAFPLAHSPAERDRALLDAADAHARSDDSAAAIALLENEMRERAVGTDVHARLWTLRRASSPLPKRLEHARRYVTVLMLEGQTRRALGLVREALDLDPQFVPPQPEHADALVAAALGAGQSTLARDLLGAMLQAWPRHDRKEHWSTQHAELGARG